MLLQQIAQDVPAEKMRIVSYHPGMIKTAATENIPESYFPGGIPWDKREYCSIDAAVPHAPG